MAAIPDGEPFATAEPPFYLDVKPSAGTINHELSVRLHQLFSTMLIKELVERTGFTKDTIRFYEKRGLISPGKKSRQNNYKDYPEQILDRLMLIRRLKDLGFTLNEIDIFMELWRGEDASCENLKYTLEDKIVLINEQLRKLSDLKTRVTESLAQCNNNDCEFEEIIPSGLKK